MYAQDLRQVFHEAYPHSHQGTSESKEMVCSALVNAGLLPFLIEKFVEEKGTVDQLLIKAQFEEAKKEIERGEKGNA